MENRVEIVRGGPGDSRMDIDDLTLTTGNIQRKELVDAGLSQTRCDEVSCQIDLEEWVKSAVCSDLVGGNLGKFQPNHRVVSDGINRKSDLNAHYARLRGHCDLRHTRRSGASGCV